VVEAIASVLAQRDCEPEIVVVDDGSTDDTRAALAPFLDRIVYHRQERRGVSAARNAGVRLATAAWLAFLDSDDLWEPEKLSRQIEFHRHTPNVSVSQTGEIWIRNGVRVNPCRHHAKPAGDIFLASLERCLVSPSAVMIHRDVFVEHGGFDESLEVCEDYDLWLRLGCRIPVGLIDEPLVVKHGGHADQLSRQHWGMDRFRVAAIAKLLSSGALDGPRWSAAARVLRDKCTILAQGAERRGREEEARRYLILASCYANG
jgi:glycosyltransferase involved in cell wall biosynthesis